MTERGFRIIGGQSPEERIAAAVMGILRYFGNRYGREHVLEHIDHRDFRDGLRDEIREAIGRELLIAKLAGLEVPLRDSERVKRDIIVTLSKVFDPSS